MKMKPDRWGQGTLCCDLKKLVFVWAVCGLGAAIENRPFEIKNLRIPMQSSFSKTSFCAFSIGLTQTLLTVKKNIINTLLGSIILPLRLTQGISSLPIEIGQPNANYFKKHK
ncbi:hypothetical protein ACJX0J_012058, partial [Zea mays]